MIIIPDISIIIVSITAIVYCWYLFLSVFLLDK